MDSLKQITERLGIAGSNLESQVWPFAIPLILKIQGEGASFFIIVDGERKTDISTIMIQGGLLGDDQAEHPVRCSIGVVDHANYSDRE